MDALIRNYQQTYAQVGQNLTPDQAKDEIAADFTEALITEAEKGSTESFEKLAAHDAKAASGFVRAIRDFIARVKRAFSGRQADEVSRNTFGVGLDKLEKAAKLWDDLLKEGEQAAQGLDVEAKENAASEETAGKFSVKNGMTDEERYNELKDKTIVVVPFNQSALAETGEDIDSLIGKYKKDAMLVIAPVAEKLGVYKKYENGTVKLEFNYSKNNLRESTTNQEKTKSNEKYVEFSKMLSCLRDVVRNAELIESHRGSGNHAGREPGNLVNTHVLVSAFKDGKFFVPVKLLVKEFTGQDNVLYVTMTLDKVDEAGILGYRTATETGDHAYPQSASSTIKLADLLRNVKDDTLRKYIPSQFFTTDAIIIDDSAQDFSEQILNGDKTIETRWNHELDKYEGQRIAIISKKNGKRMVVGYATVGKPITYHNAEEFDKDYGKHKVGPESDFYIGKKGYGMINIDPEDPDQNTLIVEITDSTWDLLPDGTEFRFTRIIPKNEQSGTAGSNIPLKDNMAEAEAQVLATVEKYLRDAWAEKIDDLEVTVEKVYSAEEEEADELLKSLNLGPNEVAFSVVYKLHPAEGVEDLLQFTAATGEIDEASGWIVNKSNVGILRPDPDGEGYIVTDFGTGF